jgi:outer membrane protein assembly factor BamB
VNFRSSMSPYWAYRRWPAQLLGVVAVGTTVVSRWTDGQLVAIDATRGTIAWRTTDPGSESAGYIGRRTGAGTVYSPVGMYTAGGVLIVTGDAEVSGYAVASGRLLWTKRSDRCATYFTGPSAFVTVTGCQPSSSAEVYRAGDGQRIARPSLDQGGIGSVAPFACTVGRSECRGVRTPGHAWLIGADGALSESPALADPRSWLAGNVVVAPGPGGTLTGASLAGGRRLWSWPATGPAPAGAQVVAVEPGAVHVLTAERDLISLGPADGLELSRLSLLALGNTMFDPGHVYAADRFVFVERLRPGAKESDPDQSYYYPSPNVLVTGS